VFWCCLKVKRITLYFAISYLEIVNQSLLLTSQLGTEMKITLFYHTGVKLTIYRKDLIGYTVGLHLKSSGDS